MIGNASARGLWVGATAGTLTALSDFAGQAGWLRGTAVRIEFLLRLLATQVPLVAIAGLLWGAWWALAPRMARAGTGYGAHSTWRVAAARALPLGLPCVAVGSQLLDGGRMSQLAHHALIEMAVVALLLSLLIAGLWLVANAIERSEDRPYVRWAAAAGLLVTSFGLGLLDRTVLPLLYEYLHGVLSVAAVASAALAVVLLVPARADQRPGWRYTAAAGLLVAGLCAAAGANLATLDRSQTQRVALMEARASHNHSLMLAAGPLLSRRDRAVVASTRVAAAERRAQLRTVSHDGLPTWPDAHLLLVTVDALRADHLGAYGHTRATSPRLDELSERAVVFERAYVQAPHSSYSLCSLMSSEYLHETLELGQPPPESTLASSLAESGYHTAAFYTDGIFHTAAAKLEHYRSRSFDFDYVEHTDAPAEKMTDRVLRELTRTAGRGEPNSFTWVHYFDVHEPYVANEFGTSDVDRYDSEIARVDAAVARLVEGARDILARDVIVVISADHGEEFREHGGVYHGSSLYEEQIRVPLIIDAPRLPAARIAAPVQLIDVMPTLLAMLGLPPPASLRGHDLRALATKREQVRGPVFSAVTYKKMVIDWPHKLVADLRFNLYELYDLAADPRERDNLADSQPELLQRLRGEVYAWLDELSANEGDADPHRIALERGRIRDRRAVAPLAALVNTESATLEQRTEAAQILARLADPSAKPQLLSAMEGPQRLVAAEAAVALGRMFDQRARETLHDVVETADPDLRARAAVSLGRLRDAAAVPGLIAALQDAPSAYEKEESVRWLGRLRDVRALMPLTTMVQNTRLNYLALIALGHLGDPRALDPLTSALHHERKANVRDCAARGLGLLADDRALPALLDRVTHDPNLKNITEALVRVGALERGAVGGTDVGPDAAGHRGLSECDETDRLHDWDFRHRTRCTMRARQAQLRLQMPEAVASSAYGSVALLGVRRADAAAASELAITIAEQPPETRTVDGEWTELRWRLPPGALPAGPTPAVLRAVERDARFELDHLLIVPLTADEQHAHDG